MKLQKQPLRLIFFSFLLVCLLTGMAGITRLPSVVQDVQAAPPIQAIVAPHVMISEFRTRGLTADDEFIEIFNATGNTVTLNNWLLRKSSDCGATLADIATINTSLAPGQYYLIAKSTGYAGTADQTYTTTIADTGGIALVDDNGVIVDQVGMCAGTTYKEGTTLAALSATVNQSYERKITGETRNCTDTNNNASDFLLNASSSNPQTYTSPFAPCLVVNGVDSTNTDTLYTAVSTNIDITVTFSGVVFVTGAPTLLLETGVTDRSAVYQIGNGTNVLTFRYTTATGDYSLDLDYVSATALSLNGGSIYDVIGNAILTLPTPGAVNSLGANRDIQVNIDNGVPPSVVSIRRQNPATTPTNANSLTFTVTFNEVVTGVDVNDFVPNSTAPTTATVTGISPAGNSSIYNVTVSGGDLANFNGVVGLDINTSPAASIADLSSVPLTPAEPTAPNDETYVVDNIGPTVTVEQATGQLDPTGTTPINFTVVFSEPIDVSTFTTTDITQAGTSVTWSITNPSGDRRTFTLSATAITQTNVVVAPSILAGRVTDDAGNTNQASTSTDNSVTFTDVTPPTVTVNKATGQADPSTTLPIRFTIVFSEPINTNTFTLSDITQGGTSTGITWTITNTGDQRTFTLTASAASAGTLTPSISANRVTDVAGNGNIASTFTDNSVIYGPPPTKTPTLSRTPSKTRTPTKPRTPTRTRTPLRTPTLAPQPLVAISEFVPRPGHDWNSDGEINTGDEYIELINHGVINVNLSGYRIDDEANIGSSPYSLPSITIKPGERIVFYGDVTGLLLSDGGDGVRLLKPNGQLMDAYNYTTVGYPDQAFCRLPDDGGADDWNKECFPTPGLRNSRGSFGPIVGTPLPESLCPFSDIAPSDFVFAECDPYGNNIWRPAYWDDPGWLNGQSLTDVYSKWDLFAE